MVDVSLNPRSVALILAFASGCSNQDAVDPLQTPEGKLCEQAYVATVDAVTEMFARRGGEPPATWPDQAEYLARCLELEMSEAQLRCLNPTTSQAEPDHCATVLEPKKASADRFTRWFNAEVREALAQPEQPEGMMPERGGRE